MTHPFNSRTRFTTWGLWILAVIMADQAIKATVEASMPLGTSIAITAGFNWVHAINPGAAFSFLADAGGWQRWVFSGLSVLDAVDEWLRMFDPSPHGERLALQKDVALDHQLVDRAGTVLDRQYHGIGLHDKF